MSAHDNTIADKIIRGENIDLAEALKEEQKQRHRREQDAVRLQLLCARIAKAIGKNVEQRTLLGAMAVMTAQAICYVHPSRHGQLFVDYLQALKAAIEGTYPKGQLLVPPDMSVLDRHIEVRTFTPPEEPITSPEHAGREEPPVAEPLVVGKLEENIVLVAEVTADDLAIPAHLKR
jgi:hypothetical protein